MQKGYISPIWGEALSNPIVTKCGLWVPLPDVISCAKFHLYHANSLWVAGPRKVTWKVTFTTARALLSYTVIFKAEMLKMLSTFSEIVQNCPSQGRYILLHRNDPFSQFLYFRYSSANWCLESTKQCVMSLAPAIFRIAGFPRQTQQLTGIFWVDLTRK